MENIFHVLIFLDVMSIDFIIFLKIFSFHFILNFLILSLSKFGVHVTGDSTNKVTLTVLTKSPVK
jgi:hypothetical protein